MFRVHCGLVPALLALIVFTVAQSYMQPPSRALTVQWLKMDGAVGVGKGRGRGREGEREKERHRERDRERENITDHSPSE